MKVTARKPAKAAPAEPEAEEDVGEVEAAPKEKQGKKPHKAPAEAKRPAPGTVKLHDSAPGALLHTEEKASCVS